MFNKKNIITRIVNVQRRFTRRITGMNNLEYEQRVMALKLPRLEYSRARRVMTETFKIIHSYYDHETVCSLFKLYESAGTRGHTFKLHKKTVLTNQYARFFLLTEMPSNTLLAGPLNSLKNHLDKIGTEYIWHKVTDENKPGQFTKHS